MLLQTYDCSSLYYAVGSSWAKNCSWIISHSQPTSWQVFYSESNSLKLIILMIITINSNDKIVERGDQAAGRPIWRLQRLRLFWEMKKSRDRLTEQRRSERFLACILNLERCSSPVQGCTQRHTLWTTSSTNTRSTNSSTNSSTSNASYRLFHHSTA
ncbi:hypothetical protein VTO42DRAFT_1768 [Malbranchea cinnamomea]